MTTGELIALSLGIQFGFCLGLFVTAVYHHARNRQ